MQLTVKTLLNTLQPYTGFVYEAVRLHRRQGGQAAWVEVTVAAHGGRGAKCGQCHKSAPGYDQLATRLWLSVPILAVATWLRYAPRRVECAEHGVVVEDLPWSEGKRSVTKPMMGFLARWARRLSWRETATVFGTSWERVYRSVEWYVQWGLAHRQLTDIAAIGVDEIYWGKSHGADRFLTVIYQIDAGCRRLLWVGRKRTEATLRRGFAALGEKVVRGLRFIATDMWRAFENVVAADAGQALHVLDRFHITMHLNQAVDEVRRAESARLRAAASGQAAYLKAMRWKLLRRGSRVRGRARGQLNALVASKLDTARAWILKEAFEHFWGYTSLTWARYFLDYWTWRALRSRLKPMQKVARMLRTHQDLLFNWFKAKGEISTGAVEGLNNKIRVVTRRSYGFRTYEAMEIALYHTLGRLPEPDELTHRFC